MPAGVALNAMQAPPASTYEQFLEFAAGNTGAARKPYQAPPAGGGGKHRKSNHSSTTSSERQSKPQWTCSGCKFSDYHFVFKPDNPDADMRDQVRTKCRRQCNQPRSGYEQDAQLQSLNKLTWQLWMITSP